MSGKNFMSFGDADTILTEFSNDIKSRVSTKANQGLTAQQKANAKTNIGIEKVPNVATNDQTPTFLEESTRTNIASGDKLSLIFGKIKKFFSDLKTVAFTGSYNDLSDTPTLVECSTARNVAAKTVTLPGFKLKTGARISVRFTDTGTSNPASGHITLNVNGTGAKEIVDGHTNMAILGATSGWVFNGNLVNDFIYDGTYWVWINRDNNTTYSAMSTSELTTGTATTARSVRADYLNAGINSLIDTKIAGKANKKTTMDSYYGTSSTAADTAAKVITVTDSDGNFSLRAGIAIMVKFSAQNTAQNPTFNVNNTGAKSVYYNNAVITTGNLWVGGNTRPARYVYDGTYWVWMGHSMDNNSTYSAMSKAELTTGTATTLRTVRADYLKAGIEELIDGKLPTVPTKLSELTDDSTHRVVTDTEKSTWNGKSNFSGSYNDLTDKPPEFVDDPSGYLTHDSIVVEHEGQRYEQQYYHAEVGNTARTLCAGNDSRLSNARPASDVYAWAKAATKPSYSWSEITSKPQKFDLVASFENTSVKEGYANITRYVTLANYDVLFVVGGAADGQLRVYNAVPVAVALNRTIQNNVYIDKRYYFNIYCTSSSIQLKYIYDPNYYLTRYIWVYGLKN